MTPRILPKLSKMALGQQSQGIGGANTKPRPQPYRKFVGRIEKACASNLHKLGQLERAKIHLTYCGKLVEGYPKCLTEVKQFKGNATKY